MPTNRETKPNGSATMHSSQAFGSGDSDSSATKTNGRASSQGIFGGIQDRVTSSVDEQKKRAADGIGGIADVFRNASDELRTQNEALASYVDMASDQLRRFADTIRERGVEDMLDDVNSFARQRPALFIGGAFFIGVGIARFLKSSAERSVRDYDNFSSVDPMTAGTGSPSYSGDMEAGGY